MEEGATGQAMQAACRMWKRQRKRFSSGSPRHLGFSLVKSILGFPGSSAGKECRRPWFDSWVGKMPWRSDGLPTPVFWPGEFHGQRSLTGYRPWGHKESDTTEHKIHLGFCFPELLENKMVFYLFIWLHWVLVEAHRIFSCGM